MPMTPRTHSQTHPHARSHPCAAAESGVRPEHVYGGPRGALAQLQSLESWFELQREFHFYSSSLLILYEGGATGEWVRRPRRGEGFCFTGCEWENVCTCSLGGQCLHCHVALLPSCRSLVVL